MSEGVRLKDKKRRAILRAAAETFDAQGFDNASMDAIAEAAGVSKRTVYNHFSSKDLLFGALVRHLQESPLASREFTYDGHHPPGDQLAEIARCIIRFHGSPEFRCLSRVIVSRLLRAPRLAAELFAGGRIFEATLRQWIDSARADGRLAPVDAAFAARQFLGLLETFTMWPQLLKGAPEPTPEEVDHIVEATVTMFLSAHAPRGDGE